MTTPLTGQKNEEDAVSFPSDPASVTSQWLEQVLRQSADLGDAKIVDFSWEKVGAGQVGDSARFNLSFDRSTSAPQSVVGKFPSADENSRQTAGALQLYEKEVRFYQDLKNKLGVRAPDTYAAELDVENNQFVLLFEDLGPADAGDQTVGCNLAQAKSAIVQAARFHSASWNNPEIVELDWLQPLTDVIAQIKIQYPQAHDVFRDRYKDMFSPEILNVCDQLSEAADIWYGREWKTNCFVHGDFRLDNMLFNVQGGKEDIAIVDWQTAQLGSGLIDIGYFLGCGIGSKLRRAHETELLQLYCDEMGRHGIPLTIDEIWDEYVMGTFHGLSTAVFASAFVERTPRGDQNFHSMALGAAELALDHDGIAVLHRNS